MISVVVTCIGILVVMSLFDLSALKVAGNRKAWAVYLSLTGVGLGLISTYLRLFSEPPSPLVWLEALLRPISGWLAV